MNALVKGASKVYCYEPDPDNIWLLKANLCKTQNDMAAICPKAVVAGGAGKRLLHRPNNPKNTWRARLEPHTGKRAGGTSVQVETTTFQHVLDAHPDATAIKMDIEGEEINILTLPGINWHGIRKIVFEYSRQSKKLN